MVFTSAYDIRLKCFNEIAYWLQNDWHALIKSHMQQTTQIRIDENINTILEQLIEESNKVKETRGRKK